MADVGTQRPRWTDEEDATLRRLYPDMDACQRELGGRARASIQRRAQALGITKTNAAWTKEEDEILSETYPTGGPKATMEALAERGYSRTRSAILSHANHMGVARDDSAYADKWTDEEAELVKQLFPKLGADKTSEELAKRGYVRTPFAVRARANILGIPGHPIRRRERGGDQKIYNFVVDTKLDKEVIERLDSVPNRSGYIRNLVAADIS